jgi:hypothetical protein
MERKGFVGVRLQRNNNKGRRKKRERKKRERKKTVGRKRVTLIWIARKNDHRR